MCGAAKHFSVRLISRVLFALCVAASLAFPYDTQAGQATLTWTAPIQNEDGTPYNDPSHYTIYAGCVASGQYEEQTVDLIPYTQTSLVVSALPEGQNCYFSATATNMAGVPSALSNEAVKFIESTATLPDAINNLVIDWQPSTGPPVMAYPSLTVTTGENAAGGQPVVQLPTTADGDLMIIVLGMDDFPVLDTDPPTGWDKLAYGDKDNGGSAAGSAWIMQKVASGTEGGTVTFNFNTSNRGPSVWAVLHITGWGGTLATDVDVSAMRYYGHDNTAKFDASGVTAGWGSDENLFIAAVVSIDDGAAPSASPYITSYTLNNTTKAGTAGTNDAPSVSIAARELEALSDTPGDMATDLDDYHYAWAIVVKPAAGGTTDALLADNVESASQVNNPAIGQVHGLLANNVESASQVSSPAIGQTHALLANNVESASELTAPALTEDSTDVLLADNVESASQISSPALGQTHVLLADNVESASQLSTPTLAEDGTDVLLADNVQSLSEVSIPALAQVHALLADNIQATSQLTRPTLDRSDEERSSMFMGFAKKRINKLHERPAFGSPKPGWFDNEN